MSVSENDLRDQLENLDWGVPTRAPEPEEQGSTPPLIAAPREVDAELDALDTSTSGLDTLDVSVAGVQPKAAPRRARAVKRQPTAQALLDATRKGQTVAANAPSGRVRRGRKDVPLVLAQEGPAVAALFDEMWREVGSKLAKSIGRSKASRQDAAIGWYALLLAMRERDAAK